MTFTVGPPTDSNAWTRGWRAFRRWRRARPFWGGLLLMLAGVELFLSANLNLGGLEIHLGFEGFLSYLLPVLLLLTGLLVWLTPNVRIFYSVIGTLTAVYSMIGLNLGGWLCGTVIGVVGGALSFAWTPVTPAPSTDTKPPTEEHDGDRISEDLDSERSTEPISLGDDDGSARQADGDDGEEPWSDDRETPRGSLFIWGASVVLAAVFVASVVARSPSRALAAPCTVTSSTETSTVPGVSATTTPATDPTSTPATDPTATPAAHPTPTPTAEPTSAPAAQLALAALESTSSATTAPSDDPCAGPSSGSSTLSPSPAAPTTTAAPPGQPIVAGVPGKFTAPTMTLEDFAFEGVTDLPTAAGSIRVLEFSLSTATAADVTLFVGSHDTLATVIDAPMINLQVRFYATRFSGELLGVPFTYTPQAPPPSTTPSPSTVITNVSMDLIFADADTLDAPGLAEALSG